MFKNGLCILRSLEGKYEIYPYPVSRSYLRKLNINRDPELVHKAKVKPWGTKNPIEFVFNYPHLKGRRGFEQEQKKGIDLDLTEEILPGDDFEPKQRSTGTQHEPNEQRMILRSNKTIEKVEKEPENYDIAEYDNIDDSDDIILDNDKEEVRERVKEPCNKQEIMKKAGLQGIISDHNYPPVHENPSRKEPRTDPQSVSLYDMMNTSENREKVNPVVGEDEIVIEEAPTIEISTESTDDKNEATVEPEIIYSLRSRDVMKR
jgi:hypothetical protein